MLETILSWPVLIGIIAVLLIGVGIGIMSIAPPEYHGARICFGTAYFLIAARLLWWATVEKPTGTDIVTSVLAITGIGVLWATADEWIITKQANDPDTKRRAQQETLTDFVKKGVQIRDTYKTLDPIPKTRAQEWETEVYKYLEKNLGEPTAFQFRRLNTTQQIFNSQPPDMSRENYMMSLAINMRLAQLDAIIKRLIG